jgi:predicted dehydrogenase
VAELTDDPYTTEIRQAYQAILSERPFEVTAEDALEALRIALAARDSLTLGKPIALVGGEENPDRFEAPSNLEH